MLLYICLYYSLPQIKGLKVFILPDTDWQLIKDLMMLLKPFAISIKQTMQMQAIHYIMGPVGRIVDSFKFRKMDLQKTTPFGYHLLVRHAIEPLYILFSVNSLLRMY